MKAPQLRLGMPDHAFHLREKVPPQWNGPRGCCWALHYLWEPGLVPPEWGHQEEGALGLSDPPDDLRYQGSRGKSVQVGTGPIVGQSVPLQSRSMLGNESCLLRWRDWSLPSRRLTRFFEPFEDVAPILPGLHCLWTAYLRQCSICPAHEPPFTRGVLSVPKKGGDGPSCKESVTWDHLGGWCKTPQLYGPTGLRRGAPSRPVGSFSGLRKPPTSLGSWYAGIAPGLTRSLTPDCPPTGRPNPSWMRLLWLPSSWRSALTSFLSETSERSSRGPQLWHSGGRSW